MAVVVALVPAAVLTAHHLLDSADAPSSQPSTHTTDLPIPPVTTGSLAATPTPPSPSQPAARSPRLPRIDADAPRRITSGSLIDSGFDTAVTEIEPASTSEVARWEPRGSPGSPGTDTVYVVGEVNGDDSGFAGLPKLAAGSTVAIRTDNGTLTYTVSAATLEPEDGLADTPLFSRHKPGRLVLVGIRYDESGDRLDKALVVTAQLSGAKRS